MCVSGMTRAVFVILLVVTVAVAIGDAHKSKSLDGEWQAFKTQYKKNYAKPKDEEFGRSIWEENLKRIQLHNEEARQGKHTYTMGMNEWGDRDDKEIFGMYLGGNPLHPVDPQSYPPEPVRSSPVGYPRTVDWRRRGCDQPPADDQQPCGSCTVFASLAALECRKSIKSRKPSRKLSVQNVLDCFNRTEYPHTILGCKGNLAVDLLRYSMFNPDHAMIADSCYGYKGVDGYGKANSCKSKNVTDCGYSVAVSGYAILTSITEEDIQLELARKGPVTVGMCVHPESLRFYKSGIYSSRECTLCAANHEVALFGYGTDMMTSPLASWRPHSGGSLFDRYEQMTRGGRYWLIKNSFGTSWGDNGFAKITRNNSLNCHLEADITFANVN